MSNTTEVYPLKGAVQHYAWGGKDFIPKLLQIDNHNQSPYAEYWIGTHHRGPAQLKINDDWKDIRDISQLPFLLKILDVDDMLSIQSHPNKQQAEIGFAQENDLNIPLDAKHRVFKDDNHKPELMVALSDFWLLHGFKTIEAIQTIIDTIPPFQDFKNELTDLKQSYSYIMNMPSTQSDAILQSLQTYLETVDCTNKDTAHYWALKALSKYGLDKGIFSIYFFNLVKLAPDEAIYQEAGVPHAYLEGQNVEIMANSDNVFRAGLTPKHIDIDLLIDHLNFDPIVPSIIEAKAKTAHEVVYKSPATEFEVRLISLSSQENTSCTTLSPECYFILDGTVKIDAGGASQVFKKGEAMYVAPHKEFVISGIQESRVIRALTPVVQ